MHPDLPHIAASAPAPAPLARLEAVPPWRFGTRVAAIMQPTYLPWLGYFDLLDSVDVFVLLDDVQLARQSWQQRNRVRTAARLELLHLPVSRGLGQTIAEARVVEPRAVEKHLRTIEQSYTRAAHFKEQFGDLAAALRAAAARGSLADLNAGVIAWLAGRLGIGTPIVRSSTLGVPGRRGDRLAGLCRAVGADAYLSPLGSRVYLLGELQPFADAGIAVRFQRYEHPSYRQVRAPFLPFASTVDLLLNEGDGALDIIRSGRRPPYLPEEVAAIETVAAAVGAAGRGGAGEDGAAAVLDASGPGGIAPAMTALKGHAGIPMTTDWRQARRGRRPRGVSHGNGSVVARADAGDGDGPAEEVS